MEKENGGDRGKGKGILGQRETRMKQRGRKGLEASKARDTSVNVDSVIYRQVDQALDVGIRSSRYFIGQGVRIGTGPFDHRAELLIVMNTPELPHPHVRVRAGVMQTREGGCVTCTRHLMMHSCC